MRLGISNIAWENPHDIDVLQWIKDFGIHFLEVAPGKTFVPNGVQDSVQIEDFCKLVEEFDIKVFAFQALLFGEGELSLFVDNASRNRLKSKLVSIIELAGKVGVENLVFGSPATRKTVHSGSPIEMAIAREFFIEIALISGNQSTRFSIEPVPALFGSDFLTTTSDCHDFISSINKPALCVHLDTSAMMINNEDYGQLLPTIINDNYHIHISNPGLLPLTASEFIPFHKEFRDFISEFAPDKILSLEMKQCEKKELKESMKIFREIYGSE
jgi:sugar phosphate isomerase/epimerase